MKLTKRVLDRINPDFVQRINEIYHDLEGEKYDNLHQYMLGVEKDFWEVVAKNYLVRNQPLVCLDFGTGSGFVPLIVGQHLKREDTFICGDVSEKMLKQSEYNIKQKSYSCGFSFIKLEGTQTPLQDRSVDVITLNSVLHHLFDLRNFAKECERILKPGGLLIASCEPNGESSTPFFCKASRLAARIIFQPKFFFNKLAEISPFMERSMRLVLNRISSGYRSRNKWLSDVAEQVKKEGFVNFNLRGVEIQQIVDFHTHKGFIKEEITAESFPQFKIIEWSTYNHLGFFPVSKLQSTLDKFMEHKWPAAGKNIRFILSLKASAT